MREREIEKLHRARPRSRLLRASAAGLLLLVTYSWLCGEIDVVGLFSPRSAENLQRFVRNDLLPGPLREGQGPASLPSWAWPVIRERGAPGLGATLAISVLASVLAAVGALLLFLPAARNLMNATPFLAGSCAPGWFSRLLWPVAVHVTRALHLVLRAIPEYVWAYLLLAMLGPSAWPVVLALAIHNAGILGKLASETVENLDAAPLRALRSLGASRAQIAASAILPLSLPRLLLYFFYRFETCVREATVLGMVGVVSLGYWIQDARARRFYDELILLVALGALLVLIGDLISALARRSVRKAS